MWNVQVSEMKGLWINNNNVAQIVNIQSYDTEWSKYIQKPLHLDILLEMTVLYGKLCLALSECLFCSEMLNKHVDLIWLSSHWQLKGSNVCVLLSLISMNVYMGYTLRTVRTSRTMYRQNCELYFCTATVCLQLEK